MLEVAESETTRIRITMAVRFLGKIAETKVKVSG